MNSDHFSRDIAAELYFACKQLLLSPDLNLENLEDNTIAAIAAGNLALSHAERYGILPSQD